jgi:hypothetical protein
MNPHGEALALLESTWVQLRAQIGPMRSLDPRGREIHALHLVGRHLLHEEIPREVGLCFARGLRQIALAQVENFPETQFWDLDFVAAQLLAPDLEAPRLRRDIEKIVRLQRSFGRHSVLCFRYTHDFIYGYDWARWVARDPQAHREHGPFSGTFLSYLLGRGQELEALIAQDDETYHRLPQGQPRNPFSFSREPAQEQRLFSTLARRDHIPVRTWDMHEQPRWRLPFAQLRQDCARDLGIPMRR